MSYWDIRQFLAEQQNIQLQFTDDAYGMQFLDPQKGFKEAIPKQQTISIPLWKASTLQTYSFESVQIQVPRHYLTGNSGFIPLLRSFKAQSILQKTSNLEGTNIKQKSEYFYELASKLKPLVKSEDFVELQFLGQILIQRAHLIMSKAFNSYDNKDSDKNKRKYTAIQYELYKMANKKIIEYNDWRYSKKFIQKNRQIKN